MCFQRVALYWQLARKDLPNQNLSLLCENFHTVYLLRPLSRLLCHGIQVLSLVLLEQIIIQFDLFKKCVLRKLFSFDISIKLVF